MPSSRSSPAIDRTELSGQDRYKNINRPHVPSVLSVLPFPPTIVRCYTKEDLCIRSVRLNIEDTIGNLQDKQDRQDKASIDSFILVLFINHETGQTGQLLDKIVEVMNETTLYAIIICI
ncbi:MAG: hypothetical protein A4E46_01686 [Methanosaeta sp. PtaU1.Bin016]|nr:MAG: hypothetical protein A4E46_01686 [Methanosaeta sp. PtaU1.Bin016]